MTKKITEKQALALIKKFYKLLDGRAHMADFFELLDPRWIIKWKDLEFKGYRGMEDHQEGKREMFNEKHTILEAKYRIIKGEMHVRTFASWRAEVWAPPAAKSSKLKGTSRHHWIITYDKEKGRPLLLYHEALSFQLTEGKLPKYLLDGKS